jgi:hypothetical protein
MSHFAGASTLTNEELFSGRPSLSRPSRKSMGKSEMSDAGLTASLMESADAAHRPQVAEKGLRALYDSQKKHVWFTIATVLVFVASFIIFERLYPQTVALSKKPGLVPESCKPNPKTGCYDFKQCIQPEFINRPDSLPRVPVCTDSRDACNYQCVCLETKPSQLTESDFAISRFMFFSPRVPFAQAGLGGAFLLSFFVTLLLRQQRSTEETQCVPVPPFVTAWVTGWQVHGELGQERLRGMAAVRVSRQAHGAGRRYDGVVFRVDSVRLPAQPSLALPSFLPSTPRSFIYSARPSLSFLFKCAF